jgi:hypothetical protein
MNKLFKNYIFMLICIKLSLLKYRKLFLIYLNKIKKIK